MVYVVRCSRIMVVSNIYSITGISIWDDKDDVEFLQDYDIYLLLYNEVNVRVD